jgi:hypothetical protein
MFICQLQSSAGEMELLMGVPRGVPVLQSLELENFLKHRNGKMVLSTLSTEKKTRKYQLEEQINCSSFLEAGSSRI